MLKMQSYGYSHHPNTAFIMHPHYKSQSATHHIRHLILEPTGSSYYNHKMWPWSASENFWIHNISWTGMKVQIRLLSLHGNVK